MILLTCGSIKSVLRVMGIHFSNYILIARICDVAHRSKDLHPSISDEFLVTVLATRKLFVFRHDRNSVLRSVPRNLIIHASVKSAYSKISVATASSPYMTISCESFLITFVFVSLQQRKSIKPRRETLRFPIHRTDYFQ